MSDLSDPIARGDPVGTRAAVSQPQALKQCCAQLYEGEVAKLLLGKSLHPGGLRLTETLGLHLQLSPTDSVLDVASGTGTSALFLAERFGCKVLGIDYSDANVVRGNDEALARGLADRVSFQTADGEALPFADGTFDALICECAYCTFPDKMRAANEFARVLRDDGRLGLSDLTRAPRLSGRLEDLLAWIACIADAQPLDRYVEQLQSAGFMLLTVATHDRALQDLVQQVRGRLLTIELMSGLKKLELGGFDLEAAGTMVREAAAAIGRGDLGYALITAARTSAGGSVEDL